MWYLNMILVCGLILTVGVVSAQSPHLIDPEAEAARRLLQWMEQKRLRQERRLQELLNKLQRENNDSAWFLIGLGADEKWIIHDTFEKLSECKKNRALAPTRTRCVPSDISMESWSANPLPHEYPWYFHSYP